jgi:hypothetical protein
MLAKLRTDYFDGIRASYDKVQTGWIILNHKALKLASLLF